MRSTPFIAAFLFLAALIVASDTNAAPASPLADAAQRGDTATVRSLLRGGAEVNATQGDGMSALHWAADRGDAELIRLLAYAGANTEAGTRIGQYTALHIAAGQGHAGAIRGLIDSGANANAVTTNSGVMPIHLAAASGNPDAVLALLEAGADANAREGAWQQTPLTFAASANRVDVIEILLDAGADPSLRSKVVDVVEMEEADKAAEKRLEQFLAQFKEKEGGGTDWQPTPSQVQAAIEASREIQRKWPDVPAPEDDAKLAASSEDAQTGTPSATAGVIYNADGQAVFEYESKEDDTPKRSSYGQLVSAWGGLTPLLHSVRQGHVEAMLALLDGGADINQPSGGDGTTPLLMSSINGQFDLTLELLSRGADPNLSSAAGTTPLFAVLERQWAPRASYAHPVEHQQKEATHLDVLAALLNAGADPNLRMKQHLWYTEYTFFVLSAAGIHYEGATPFWRAAQALDVDAMRLLKDHGADPNVASIKQPPRRRPMDEAQAQDAEEEKDHSGLPEVPIGGPFIYPIHAAAGAGYGQYFAGNAHRHVPNNWLPAVRYLVEECGADVDLRDANGYTALHHAASRGDNALVKYLVEKGADVTVVSRKGQTTADMANGPIQRVSPFPDTIELLVGLGAKNNNNCVSC